MLTSKKYIELLNPPPAQGFFIGLFYML